VKKRIKKLMLSRETLRRLEEQDLQAAAGVGATTSACACSNSACSKLCDDRCDTGNPYTR
jgi:hypothetical protein